MRKHSIQLSSEIEIDSFTKKGDGLGKTIGDNPRVVEVPFCIPGDKVQAQLHRKKGGVYSSRLESVITPSKNRIDPKCVHFAACGGCRWQQMTYEHQLAIKQERVESLFLPLLPENATIPFIVPSDPFWKYRNKMEFTFSSDSSGKKYVGLILDGSRGKVLNLSECHLVNPWFIEALKSVRAWWNESDLLAYHPYSNQGSLRTLIIREGLSSGDRLVMLTVSGCPEYALKRHQIDSFITFLRDAIEPLDPENHLTIFLRIQQALKGVETTFYEMLLHGPDHIRERLEIEMGRERKVSLSFDISPSAFFQPNTKQSEKLYSLALQMLEIGPETVVYDLYCGTGTLGICAGKYAKQVVGIEISAEACLDARNNAKKNGLNNIEIINGAVAQVIEQIEKQLSFPRPDIVMVDPPRSGLDPVTLQHLIHLKPSKILYISCNPVSQAENVLKFIEEGYVLKTVQPVDQFPHTFHIENIVVLVSNSVN